MLLIRTFLVTYDEFLQKNSLPWVFFRNALFRETDHTMELHATFHSSAQGPSWGPTSRMRLSMVRSRKNQEILFPRTALAGLVDVEFCRVCYIKTNANT